MGHKTRLQAITLATALVSGTVSAECFLRQATGVVSEQVVQRTDIINQMIVPTANGEGMTCSVMFKLQMDNQWYTGYGEYDMAISESEVQGCKIALEKGKHELLLSTSTGNKSLKTQQSMVCSDEPELEIKPTAIGDIVRESQVTPDPRRPDPFSHQGTYCKRYIETSFESDSGLYQWHGVICQLAPTAWVVTDKW